MKGVLLLALLSLGVQHAGAFALVGPTPGYATSGGTAATGLDPWQIPNNGFNPLGAGDAIGTGPKNLGEEYRRNTPVLYYTFDQNFLDYFGSNGVYAVEQAISVFNGLANVSSYSADLSEWPLEAARFNYQAQSLSLLDMKSVTMSFLCEQLGLAEPEHYTWILHNRHNIGIPGAPPCPDDMEYNVVKRNFDPVPSPPDQFWTSSYVNGTLYSYVILEVCTGAPPLADAVEFNVDPDAPVFTSIASRVQDNGEFFLSLTRDDVGGLRYLMRTNNMNIESTGPDTVAFVTNNNAQLLFTSNLTLFAAQALTNNAATLQALYPGLIITSSTNFFTNTFITNLTATFVIPPFAPAGTFTIRFTTNIIGPIVQTLFVHTFANVATIQFINGHWVTVPLADSLSSPGVQIVETRDDTLQVRFPPFAGAGIFTLSTNTTRRFSVERGPVGEFIILPTNWCDVTILAVQATNIIPNTNIIVSLTNVTLTNLVFFGGQVSQIHYFTNHTFVVFPVLCPPGPRALFQGVERIRFVRRDFDSLFNPFWPPVTNIYVLNEITNNAVKPRTVRRDILFPDFIFSAADFAPGPDTVPGPSDIARNLDFDMSNALGINGNTGNLLAGPGTITNQVVVLFQKAGPFFYNYRLDPIQFLDELTQIPFLIWGSFDGTTNAPIVYPNGQGIIDIENQILMPILPTTLADGIAGVPYSVQFTTTGGQAPYTWTQTPGSGSLPPGFTLNPDGTLAGTPGAPGTFNFAIRLTEAGGRVVDYPYSFTVNP